MSELTVFIRVNIDNLNELSKSKELKVKIDDKIKREKIKIKMVKKYLFISSKSKFIFVNINLFIKTFLGLLKDNIWFSENLNNEKIFIKRKPELDEKKDPPMITKIKKIKVKFDSSKLIEKPIFDILLETEKK